MSAWRSPAGALGAAFTVSLGLLAVLGSTGTPYAVEGPGPVQDVLGEASGEPLITVEGRRTYPTQGRLDLLTVSTAGGPGRSVPLAQAVGGWLDPVRETLPVDQVFAPGQTREQVEEQSEVQMSSSQEAATVAALTELDIPVGVRLRVAGPSEDGGDPTAQTPLREGDVITAVDGDAVATPQELRERLQQVLAGTAAAVTVERDGRPVVVEAPTRSGRDGTTVLGVLLDGSFDIPFEVSIRIDDVGGPSAGMIFALGLVDQLTPGALTGGEHVAGTGTISAEGDVGAIGGIRQKLVGADAAGAGWFLAPAQNCAEVVGHVPPGLRVVRVETLAQARDALEAVAAGRADDLPTCTAAG